MIHSFYFRFYTALKLKHCSVILAYLARLVFFAKFLFYKCTRERREINLSSGEAMKFISKVHPDPGKTLEITNREINDSIDLSIIMPIYNHEDVIENNIEAVLNQRTKFVYELILVDDGSNQETKKILKKYENNSKVKVIYQNNMGIGGARNTGINNTSGRYLMFVDCDDVVHDDIVECLMSRVEDDGIDIAMCAHRRLVMENGNIKRIINNVYSGMNLQGYANGQEIINYAGLPWCKVYKRELFDRVRFFPGYWYEDTIIQLLLFTQCKSFCYVPEVKYDYIWNNKNYSHVQGNSSSIKSIDCLWIMRAIIKQYKEIDETNNAMFYTLLLKHFSTYYYSCFCSLSDEIIEAMFITARQIVMDNKPKEKEKLPYILRQTEKAFEKNDIELWKLCSTNQ